MLEEQEKEVAEKEVSTVDPVTIAGEVVTTANPLSFDKLELVRKALLTIVGPCLSKSISSPFEPSPVSYFYNADYDNISTLSTNDTIHLTKRATIITNPFELTRHIYHNYDIFYDGDDDEELFLDEIKRIQQILKRTSFDAITPNFLITDSLSMGDEHLSTISETGISERINNVFSA
ncbi:hypothetical protein Tco_1473336 [Tanacetum coccineum]